MTHQSCPGYVNEPFATLVAQYPGQEVYPPAQFRLEWGPMFHRGRLDGSARVLVLGQDPAAHEAITRRILVGVAGHRVQGLLARLGISESYVMVNAFLYSVYGQRSGEAHERDPVIAEYRNKWLDALLIDTDVTAVIAMGRLANSAYRLWMKTQPVASERLHLAALRHPTYPESAAVASGTPLEETTANLMADWNAKLPALAEHITAEAAVDLTPYDGGWRDRDLAEIPERDLPAGSPEWWRHSQEWADRYGRDTQAKRATIRVKVPPVYRDWPRR